MKKIATFVLLLTTLVGYSQLPDHIYRPSIRTVKLYKAGDIFSYPAIALNAGELLELHFDDMDADAKNCYYTYQLCNADWTPSDLQYYDFIRGFQSTRITTYRYSSIANTKYTHYYATLPDRNSLPTKSGNYLLKVFLNSDTSALLFTKRFLVIDNRVSIAAQTLQPFNFQLSRTDQRIHVGVSTNNAQINVLSPQDLKVVVLQNNIWPTAIALNRPNIYRVTYFEYNDDALSFPAGKEWRWADLRSMQLMSDRVEKMIDTSKRTDIYIKTEGERRSQVYVYYSDLNGTYTVENTDGYNPFWQSDYGYVHFTYVPPANQPYAGKDIYIFGELTNYSTDDDSRLDFNRDKGVYEKTLLLKQGYYSYTYVTKDIRAKDGSKFSFADTEGNFNITENNYTVLVYYRAFGARYDELIGFNRASSLVVR